MDLKELKRKKEEIEKELLKVFREIEETGAVVNSVDIIRGYDDSKIESVQIYIEV